MTDPVFDKEGNLSNLDELDRDEVASAYQEKNRSLFGRATDAEKKAADALAAKATAEAALEEARKTAPTVPPVTPPVPQGASAEELRLIARGLSDDEIEKAKKVAVAEGISLTEALSNDLFTAWQAATKAKRDQESAKLRGSHGSDQTVSDVGISSGMKSEDHHAAWRKAAGLDPVTK